MAQTPNTKLNKHPTGSAQSNNAVIDNNWDILDAALGNTIGQGILADRPATGQYNGATFWVTDQGNDFAYVWDAVGVTWITKSFPALPTLPYITGRGLFADRPADGETVGALYFVTDKVGIAFYVWDGAAWQTELAPAISGLDADLPATAENGAVYIPTDNSEVVLYIRSAGVWVSKFVTMSGLDEDLPAAAEDGAVYIPTDNESVVLYIRTDGAWLAKSGGGGGGGSPRLVPSEDLINNADEVSAYLEAYISQTRLSPINGGVEESNIISTNKFGAVIADNGYIYMFDSVFDLYKIHPDDLGNAELVNSGMVDPLGVIRVNLGKMGNGFLSISHGTGAAHLFSWFDTTDNTYGTVSTVENQQLIKMLPLPNSTDMGVFKNGGIALYSLSYLVKCSTKFTSIAAGIPIPGSGFNRYFGSCVLPNGDYMLAPHIDGDPFYLFNVVTETFTEIASPGAGVFDFDGIVIPGNKVVWIPVGGGDMIQIYDISTNTFSDSVAMVSSNVSGGLFNTTLKLLPTGEILLIDANSSAGDSRYRFYDPFRHTISDFIQGSDPSAHVYSSYDLSASGKLIFYATSYSTRSLDLGLRSVGVAHNSMF